MKQKIIALLEGKKKETDLGGNMHNIGYNKGIDTAIKSIDEIVKPIIDWLEKRCEDNMTIQGTAKWNADMEDLLNLLKE
jgi:hypothetical protein